MSSHYNKHESKYFNTALLMDEALLNLLETKEYEYITISELCKKAGVNRSTFYLHYLTMDDVLREVIELSNQNFNCRFSTLDLTNLATKEKSQLIFITPQYLLPYLNYIKENKKIFLIAKRKPELFQVQSIYHHALDTIIFPILEYFKVEEREKKYLAAYYISGIQSMVMAWITDDCKDEITYVSNLIIDYVFQKRKQTVEQ